MFTKILCLALLGLAATQLSAAQGPGPNKGVQRLPPYPGTSQHPSHGNAYADANSYAAEVGNGASRPVFIGRNDVEVKPSTSFVTRVFDWFWWVVKLPFKYAFKLGEYIFGLLHKLFA